MVLIFLIGTGTIGTPQPRLLHSSFFYKAYYKEEFLCNLAAKVLEVPFRDIFA